ncbi:MAG: ATP-binding protein [Clostridia bacterium]|nr:ATP-binding protein [Clostridia bacterium]
MAYNSNNEVRFVELRKDIERYSAVGDYKYTKTLIEKAMVLCGKIYESTLDPEKKQIMRDNAAKLKLMYAKCKKELGEEDSLTYTADPSVGSTRPKADAARKTAPDGKNASAKSDGGINYVINGIDVEAFMEKDSNEVVTFDDVKGMEEEKKLIQREFFLNDKQREFNRYLGKKDKNFILMYGVPGTGKTFFVKALSEELKRYSGEDIPFFCVKAPLLEDCKVGATEKNIQAVFEFCKQFPRCVLFIDEFDAIAPDRKKETGDPTAVSRVTVLLQMMDGFSSATGTLLIAATNCPYNLDTGILSRANARIEVPLPDANVICSILEAKIGDKIADDVDLEKVSAHLAKKGYSNRDLKNVIGELIDMLSSEFAASDALGDTKAFDEYRYTKQMIKTAIEKVTPVTTSEDLLRIAEFKRGRT